MAHLLCSSRWGCGRQTTDSAGDMSRRTYLLHHSPNPGLDGERCGILISAGTFNLIPNAAEAVMANLMIYCSSSLRCKYANYRSPSLEQSAVHSLLSCPSVSRWRFFACLHRFHPQASASLFKRPLSRNVVFSHRHIFWSGFRTNHPCPR